MGKIINQTRILILLAPTPGAVMAGASFWQEGAEVRLATPDRLKESLAELGPEASLARVAISQPWLTEAEEIKPLLATLGRAGSDGPKGEVVWAIPGHNRDAVTQVREALLGLDQVQVVVPLAEPDRVAALGGRPGLDVGHPGLRDYLWSKLGLAEMGLGDPRPILAALKALQKKPFSLTKAEVKGAELLGRAESPFLLSRSEAVQRLKGQVLAAAETDLNVLLSGPPGSGREALTRFIHAFSPRRDKPFVVLDGAAVDPERLRSDLFGQAQGAFPWANQDETGLLQAAAGGTLVLAQADRLPLSLQYELAAAFKRRSFRPVAAGRDKETPLEVRIIALVDSEQSRQKTGRSGLAPDLHAQVADLEIHLPGLAEADLDPVILYLASWHDPDGQLQPTIFEKLRAEAWAALAAHPGFGPLDLRRLVRRMLLVKDPSLFELSLPRTNRPQGILPTPGTEPIVPLATVVAGHVQDLAARRPDLPRARLAQELGISLNTLRKYLKPR